MHRRNKELTFLLAGMFLLGTAGWYSASERIGRSERIPSQSLEKPYNRNAVNLLRCAPEELRAVLSLRVADPELSRVQEAILEWRKTISLERQSRVFLAQLMRTGYGRSGPAILDAEVYRSLRPYWVVRDPSEARRTWLENLAWLFAAFLIAHMVFRFTDFRGNEVLLPLALLLCGTSTILQFAFTDPLRERLLYIPFVTGIVVGCVGLVIAARFTRIQALARHKFLPLAFGALLVVMLGIWGGGPAGTDAKLNLFGLFQPVEFVEILLVLFLAAYLTHEDGGLSDIQVKTRSGVFIARSREVIPLALLFSVALGLCWLQRDLEPALILYLVFLGMLMATPRRFVRALFGLVLLLGSIWTVYRFQLMQAVAARVAMWLSPWDNHAQGGVQLAESLWALASGAFWGAGPGRGDPQYIPAGHTDLILAAAGELLGFPGLTAILAIQALLFGIMVHCAWKAKDRFVACLGIGLALLMGVQTSVIASGTVGLAPLSGLPVPLMSYGKSATIAYFILIGLVLNLSSPSGDRIESRPILPRAALTMPSLTILGMMCASLWAYPVMSFQADETLCRGSLTLQQDGVRRFAYNRRLLDVAALITRGSIVDRTGIPLATSRVEDLDRTQDILHELGIDPPRKFRGRRIYPFGPYTVQVLGHTRGYWVDPKTVERAEDVRLRGYPGTNEVLLVDGKRVIRQDLSALTPAFRDRFSPSGGRLEEFEQREKTVRLTLDARMQVCALRALERHLPQVNGLARTKGAAVILNASTGAILACVSLPTYDPNAISETDLDKIYGAETKAALDRARFEIYPPGSTFDLAVGAAALDSGWAGAAGAGRTYVCRHEDEIRWQYDGTAQFGRIVDREVGRAHGRIDLRRAFVASCDVYFAWLGTQLGPDLLFDYARNRFLLELKGVGDAGDLVSELAANSNGEARITASPLRMAAVAAEVVNGGYRIEPSLLPAQVAAPRSRDRILKPATAATLRDWMRQAVESGTGHAAATPDWVIGGKPGIARNDIFDRVPHSWFVGFAWPGHSRPEDAIALAFLIENGGQGGQAALAAHDFLSALDQGDTKHPRPR